MEYIDVKIFERKELKKYCTWSAFKESKYCDVNDNNLYDEIKISCKVFCNNGNFSYAKQ